MAMFNYDNDEDPYEGDEQFYRETVYNEDYYIGQEQEMIRQSNLEIELERLEDENIREMREEGLLRPTLVKPGDNKPEDDAPAPVDYPDDPGELPF
jgi:hypothetical protein